MLLLLLLIIIKTKFDNLSYTDSLIKVEVTAPILAQGQLSENVVFVTSSSTPIKDSVSSIVVSTSSSQGLVATSTP